MKKSNTQLMLATAVLIAGVGITLVSAQPTEAFEGVGRNRRPVVRHELREAYNNASPEQQEALREAKAEFQNMSPEEKQALREALIDNRQERRAEITEFIGLTPEEVKAELESGKTVSDILTEQGISEEEMRAFMTTQATQKADQLVEDGKITQQTADSILTRLKSTMERFLARWY